MSVEIITILSLIFIISLSYISSKAVINSRIKKLIPFGVEFADKLKNNTNKEKLTKAVSFVELSIIKIVPTPFKPLVDYLIDTDKIVKYIERYLTELKLKDN